MSSLNWRATQRLDQTQIIEQPGRAFLLDGLGQKIIGLAPGEPDCDGARPNLAPASADAASFAGKSPNRFARAETRANRPRSRACRAKLETVTSLKPEPGKSAQPSGPAKTTILASGQRVRSAKSAGKEHSTSPICR